MSENGDHVTWRELNLALKPMLEDISEIKTDVKAIRGEAWLGPRGRELLTGAGLLSALVAIVLALLH